MAKIKMIQRVLRTVGMVTLCGLSAYGAAQLALGLGIGFEGATMACVGGFFGNFFAIDGLSENIIIRK
jgi:hypothetical protein